MDNNTLNSAPKGPNLETVVEEVTTVNSQPTANVPKDNVVFADQPKKGSKAAILGMICFALLAVAGIAFGIWSMLDKENTVKSLNEQISSLRAQNTDLQSQISELQAAVSTDTYEILPPAWGEATAVIENGLFTIKNKDGETYMTLEDYEITEITSCDSGTAEEQKPMTCTVTTTTGPATIIYDFDEHSLEYIGS